MTTQEKIKNMIHKKYQPNDYNHLIGMKGFSDRLLKDHFKLYQGYVSKTNEALDKLAHYIGKEEIPTEINEVRRRLGWEMNGVRLHEYYFDNLGGHRPLDSGEAVASMIDMNFGNFENWRKDFVATGAMRGIGWVILYQEPKSENLFNVWIEQHHSNHFAGAQPLLVMDVFEHAYMTDYGTDKIKYIDAFFKNINWEIVSRRVV